ncbi:MAG TPA: Hsp20/alpha crystallin family protein [Caulifigura sp.]|nr:Hsp20/alpha crystallin family protein [Caulifigura sp.]
MAIFDRRARPGGRGHQDVLAHEFRPAADVYRTATGWLVKLELAGVSPNDVQVAASGNRLVVRGRRRDSVLTQCRQCVSLEISYSSFERHIEFPGNIERARWDLEMRDGMLLIHLTTGEPS